ncbi:MAG: hypothetical protein JWN04_6266 [Myxococcaceae bacterium]|nr:hypothetical protein [Myxococcaceae bacterium]
MGCAWADAKPLRLPANVWLVANLADLLEMNAPDTPWKRTHAVLTEPGNIIEPLQSTIRFGAVFHGGQYDQPMCPTLRRLEPAVGNFAALRDLFPATPPVGNDSEAAYALESIRDWQMSSDPSQASNTVVLVRGFTSEIVCEADAPPGMPGNSSTPGYERLRDDIASLRGLGIRTFVITMDDSPGFFMADASRLFAQLGGTLTPYGAASADELKVSLQAVFSDAISCDIQLAGTVSAGEECRGEVSLDDELLACNGADGWRLKGDSTVELVGAACERIRQSPHLSIRARFPCDVILL